MTKQTCFYKIEDAETLAKIDEFLAKRDQFFKAVKKMCDLYGFDHYSASDSIQTGIRFFGILANPKTENIDLKLWKTSKHKTGYLRLEPRATAKSHKTEYLSMVPKKLEYTELNELILAEEVMPWGIGYGYTYKKGQYFMFETSLHVLDVAIEIIGSEYSKVFSGEIECEAV